MLQQALFCNAAIPHCNKGSLHQINRSYSADNIPPHLYESIESARPGCL